MITASGLGSGLDIEGLVSQLVAAERQAPELRLTRAESKLQATLSGFGQLKSALADFRNSVITLADSSLYKAMRATSSDVDSLFATATASASEGSYDVEVSGLATRHSLASGSFVDRDSTAVGTGTLTIRFGTTNYDGNTDSYTGFSQNTGRGTLSLTIDSSNNTLEGIAETINSEDAGVRASIVNDGSGYRLLLSSEFTGAENSLEIAVSDSDGNGSDTLGLSRLAFNSAATNLEQTAAAADAQFTINGLSISSAENRVSDVLDGVTLDLKSISDGPVALEVRRDLTSVESAVQGFIAKFNELQGTLTTLAGYNAASEEGGLLQGDFTVSAVENRIKNILRSAPEGFGGELQRLSQVGITTASDGTLELDSATLRAALEDNLEGVAGLFSVFGQSGSDRVTFLGSTESTASGEYAINISQSATRGQLGGAGVLPSFTGGGNDVDIDANNDTFSIKVDGVDLGVITLTQGRYDTGDLLAAELQSKINSAAGAQSADLGVTVVYSALDNGLTLTSNSYGAESAVEITAVDTDTAATLGLGVGAGTSGTDMVGTINGVEATANGLILTAAEGTAAEGLRLEIDPGAVGDLGVVAFGFGLFERLDDALDQFLVADGLLDNRSTGLQDRIDDIEDQRVALERRLESIEARYRSQFAALDLLLSQLQTTSDYLTQQLASLPGPAFKPDS